jgi:hypothetical protein
VMWSGIRWSRTEPARLRAREIVDWTITFVM